MYQLHNCNIVIMAESKNISRLCVTQPKLLDSPHLDGLRRLGWVVY